ncbi:MAG TPA: hypothetical protein VEV17_09805 [Bryobacteraceae bacterium]|nr:hypothetical protein [Bryobacteraceae bacterium]
MRGIIHRIHSGLDLLASNWFFAYFSITALQLKVIWGIWLRKDLPFGDTASYYVLAQAWHLTGADMFVWSPLYTTFLGSFLSLSPDAYFATIAHRMLIVLALAVLVLGLMRSLLPPIVAWWTTAWWVLLPINFESLYEVHLFFVVLILILYLAVLHLRGILGRGVGVAALLVIGVLMRNEVLVSLLLFAGVALGFDLWRCFRKRLVSMPRILFAYGAPLLLALLLCGFFYARSIAKWPELEGFLSGKHTLNVCQIYAFSYQQRHPDWTHSPWTECQPLIQTTFGKPEVALWEATRLNPRAMLEYYWWNVKLIPSGLQVLLFNVAAGRVDPDYAPVSFNPRVAIPASCLLAIILIVGGMIFFQNRAGWYKTLVQPGVWGWIVMACVGLVVIIVMVTERPRPSYMFSLGLLIMASAGLCVQLVSSSWAWLSSVRPWFPIAAIALIVITPCYYYLSPRFGSRPNLEVYRHMHPFQGIVDPDVALMAPNAGPELCFYLSRITNRYCEGINFWTFRDSIPPGGDWNQALTARKVKFFLANESVLTDKAGASFVKSAQSNGWQVRELEDLPGNRWMLLEKQ